MFSRAARTHETSGWHRISVRARFNRLYVRIYATVLAALALSVLLVGLAARWTYDERPMDEGVELVAQAVAELVPREAPAAQRQAAMDRWAVRSRADLALYDADGQLLAATADLPPAPFTGRHAGGWHRGTYTLRLPDGRWLVASRPWHRAAWAGSLRFVGFLGLIAAAVGIAAYPLVRRLTRGLEQLQSRVEALGAGDLSARAVVRGHDEVARLARSFNASAARIEALIRSQRSLLANASHELRSPLARIRMAIEAPDAPAARGEAVRSIAELDALVEEILLASRLDAGDDVPYSFEPVDLTGLVAEECARAGVPLQAEPVTLSGNPTLLRRLVRNLLENARRHAGDPGITVTLRALESVGERAVAAAVGDDAETMATDARAALPRRSTAASGQARVVLDVCDRGPGVPATERERVFEPFYRSAGASERYGGVGLGLALVRQIAERHGGTARCQANDGGGSCFQIVLPMSDRPQPGRAPS
jgi:signal transduction histidine kinase